LKIKVTAPPVDAAANEALIELLAEKLDCPRGRVELIRGRDITAQDHQAPRIHTGASASGNFREIVNTLSPLRAFLPHKRRHDDNQTYAGRSRQ
jgi:hypothetical protein